MGANIGATVYYIVEIVIFSWIAYISFIKPEAFMTRIFKDYTKKHRMLTYGMGIVAITQIIRSVNGIL